MNNSDKRELRKLYPVNKIRVGDPTVLCGNNSCPLARKVKTYIRKLAANKQEFGKISDIGKYTTKEKTLRRSPSERKTTSAYIHRIPTMPNYRISKFGKNYVVGNLTTSYQLLNDIFAENSDQLSTGRCNRQPQTASFGTQVNCKYKRSELSQDMGVNTMAVYNTEVKTQASVMKHPSHSCGKEYSVYNFCLNVPDINDTECKCKPPKPTPPCKTFDCECITEMANIESRKRHKPYCPAFKHKSHCPVMMKKDEEKLDEEEDEAEPLPYGLPPIQLGPCPVMGKPCANPDGFSRMYKTQAHATLPPSYTDAGKVCCSKEYERIKNAIKEYMKYEKDHDYRCINTFNVDTERRCCDREQRLLSLLGKDCCGTHKLALHNKHKEPKN